MNSVPVTVGSSTSTYCSAPRSAATCRATKRGASSCLYSPTLLRIESPDPIQPLLHYAYSGAFTSPKRRFRSDDAFLSSSWTSSVHDALEARRLRRNLPGILTVTAALARAEPVSTPEVEKLLDSIKWDSKGLVVAIAQHIDTGAILMQGYANRDAISATVASCRATFFSRSRSSLWTKGESSQNFINVVDVYLDCDRDSVIYLGNPDGPTCHTGAETCFYTPASDLDSHGAQALTTLYSLEAKIAERKAEVLPKPSWTKKLIENPKLLCSKIREEADELCSTIENDEGRERTTSEMADLLYHSMVLLAVQDVKVKEVLEILRGRFSKSGIEEKTSRSQKS